MSQTMPGVSICQSHHPLRFPRPFHFPILARTCFQVAVRSQTDIIDGMLGRSGQVMADESCANDWILRQSRWNAVKK